MRLSRLSFPLARAKSRHQSVIVLSLRAERRKVFPTKPT